MGRLYTGLDSALLRQATYTTARLGLYRTFMDWGAAKHKEAGTNVPLWEKSLYSLSSGALASIVGNPADLALVRMQADSNLPEAQRRNYTSVFNAISRIIKEEGVLTLWRGSTPTVFRAMSMNLGMLAPYDQAKETLTRIYGDSEAVRISSSLIAAFFACTFSLPFDNIKTKYQKMVKNADGSMPYKNFFDCFSTSFRREGVLGLYVGFATYLARVGPHAIIVLLLQDWLQRNFNQ